MKYPGDAALVAAWGAVTATPRPGGDTVVADPLDPLLALVSVDRVTVAGRDAAALDLLAAVGDGVLQGEATCPACAARLDVALEEPVVAAAPAPASDRVALVVGGRRHTVRPPTLDDLDDVLGLDLDEATAVRLLAAALLDPPPAEGDLDDDALAAVDGALAGLVGDALVQPVELRCPDCASTWTADVALDAFVRERVDRRARRVLDEVHDLASAYGWTPATVLELPQRVRDHHLARVR